ncbi:hypothetical protein ACFU98_39955 [Streptomyces sp. NPDC057575]
MSSSQPVNCARKVSFLQAPVIELSGQGIFDALARQGQVRVEGPSSLL